MIKVGVFYPQGESTKFDMRYYLEKHIPMVREKMGAALKGVEVEEGLGGGMPGSPRTYATLCHLLFDSVDAFQAAFIPHATGIMGDISNYTNVQPIVQISEVKL